MVLTPLLAVLLSRQTATPIATYTWGKREVAVTLPESGGELPEAQPYVSFEGWNYFLDSRGTPVLKARGHGGWPEVTELYNEAKAKWTAQTPVWHVKVILFTRSDILDKTPDGLLRQRRTLLNRTEILSTLQDVGRFLVSAEAAANGAYRVKAEVEVDEDPLLLTANSSEEPIVSKDFIERTVQVRTNSGGYEADDKQYRGPFQSVFVLHPAMTDGFVRTAVYGVPVSSFSVYAATVFKSPNLPAKLLSCWAADLANTVPAPYDFPHGDDITTAISAAQDSLPLSARRDNFRLDPPLAKGVAWEDAKADPARLLPLLNKFHTDMPTSGFTVIPADGGEVWNVPTGMADLVSASDPSFRAIGYYKSASEAGIVFRTQQPSSSTPYEHLKLADRTQHKDGLGATGFSLVDFLKPTPNYLVKLSDDPEHGKVVTLAETGDIRSGHAVLPAEGDPKGNILRIDVKSSSKDPIALTVLGAKGPTEIVLGWADPAPSDARSFYKSIPLAFRPDGTWQTIQVDLTGIAEPGSLVAVTPPYSEQWYEKRQLDPIVYNFAKLAWVAAVDGTSTPQNPTKPEIIARATLALTADVKTLIPLLDDHSDIVVVNVAQRFQKIKSALAESALIRLANGGNPRVAEEALRALDFQGTEPAELAIRKVLDESPFDQNRVVAAEILASKKDARAAGPISRIFAVNSWQARLRAAELIAALPGPDAKAILLTFLLQNEPEIRLAVTRLADPSFELACRRLLYGSVNDPSDAVRAASYLQLLKSPLPKYRAEAIKGVGDDSAAVRLEVLRAISAKPGEADRGAFQQAVADKSPSVRAEALRGFAKLSGPVKLEEIENVLKDEHTEVQLALIALAIEKKIPLPADAVAKLKGSQDTSVSSAAQSLPGS